VFIDEIDALATRYDCMILYYVHCPLCLSRHVHIFSGNNEFITSTLYNHTANESTGNLANLESWPNIELYIKPNRHLNLPNRFVYKAIARATALLGMLIYWLV
jgi:hypothetical protein